MAGELTATKQCLPCPQPDPYMPKRMIGDEDCLCLNVFAPKMPGEETGSPVIFFIHGGNYRSGSTSAYGGQHFAQKDTILVTAQYRLGALGYLSTGQRDASGNLGLFDLHTAMVWINEYIEFFGGDKNRVVLMGQGSGGSAASLLALSPEGRSATGVAAMSGTPLSPGAVRPDPQKHASALANATGCPSAPAERLVLCLRKMPVEKVVLADADLNMGSVDTVKFLDDISGRSGAGARVEGEDDLRALPPLVVEPPADSLKKKDKRVPLLTGVTSAETSRAVYGKYNKFLTNQLQSVKDFIKKDLIGGLQSVVAGVEGLLPFTAALNQVLPLTDYYQAVFTQTANAVDGLSQIAEATGDALFNFPAYQTVNAWSGGGSAFLYSFEHVGNLSKGAYFLPGVPLADQSNGMPEGAKLKGPAHGDELAYLFEPLDAEGKPTGGVVSGTDARARDSFVGLVAKFAHRTDKSDKKSGGGFFDKPFSKDTDQFLKITDQVKMEKEFRFCQMGMWGNMGDRLTSALCKNLITDLLGTLPIGDIANGKIPLVSGQNPLGALTGQQNVLPLGGLTGQQNSMPLGGLLGQTQGQQKPQSITGGLFGQRAPSRNQATRKTTPKSNLLDIPFDF
nr:putative antennal esterase CXE32 [Ectropis grisescens]